MGGSGAWRRGRFSATLAAACALATGLSFAAVRADLAYGATHTFLGNSVHRLALQGSNGYQIRVSSYVSRIYHRISLTAEKDGAYARYSVQGVAKNGHIRARFPGLGEIAVHFQRQSVKKLTPRPGCHLPKEVIERGSFVGRIRFVGEMGYTEVNTTKARGAILKRKKQTCQVQPRSRSGSLSASASRGPARRFEGITLRATAGEVRFTASNVNGRPRSSFEVKASETEDEMTIVRSIQSVSATGAFEYDREDLASATVTPPTPFLGEASYTGLRDPGMFPGYATEGVISGSLRVPLPGLGVVALAGTDVSASLSRTVGVID